MTKYTGTLSISGSIEDSNGDTGTFSGNLGITLTATLDSAASGTATEAITGSLNVLYSYAGGGSGSSTIPFNFNEPSVPFHLGSFDVGKTIPVAVKGADFGVTLSGSVVSDQTKISENMSAAVSGSYSGVTFAATVTGSGSLLSSSPPPPRLTTLVNFTGPDGTFSRGALIADKAGDLFGTTNVGGAGFGTVFEIANTGTGYATTPTVLVSFNSTDGANPYSGLLADAAGNLFGTTFDGGASNNGEVFEVAKTPDGYASTPTLLVSFNDTDGQSPYSTLIADSAGDLFGTTSMGGANGDGTVFEIVKTPGGFASTPTTLVTFTGTNGANPHAGLLADKAGDLFGTTRNGGANGDGSVFEIVKTGSVYASTPTTLVSFNFLDGLFPEAGLVADAAGDLFGTTSAGGTAGPVSGNGTVFEIANTVTGYATTPIDLETFNGGNGADPFGGLIIDGAGDLFGTTETGGVNNESTVFEIAKTSGGYSLSINTTNGATPESSLFAGPAGNLFGSGYFGGSKGYGTVFEMSGAGFVAACYVRGTRIATPACERAIELLVAGDVVLTKAGEVRPIVWIGHRRLDCRRHPKPRSVWPVRIRFGAFGDGVPRRDLWLSPDHAVFVDDVLIPIKQLINGTSIAQVPRDDVTYFHIELPRHDVLLAEGLPAESYLDTADRSNFDNGGWPVALHPDFRARRWDGAGCAPLIVIGPILEAVRQRLNSLAAPACHAVNAVAAMKST